MDHDYRIRYKVLIAVERVDDKAEPNHQLTFTIVNIYKSGTTKKTTARIPLFQISNTKTRYVGTMTIV